MGKYLDELFEKNIIERLLDSHEKLEYVMWLSQKRNVKMVIIFI